MSKAETKSKPDKVKKKKKDKGDVTAKAGSEYEGVARSMFEDKQTQRTLERVERVYTGFDIEREIERLVSLHETRHIRKLSVKEILSDQQHKLIEAELQNGAHRSTAVSIQIRVTRANYTIYDALIKLRKYLHAAYSAELKAEASTVQQRSAIVDMLLMKYDQWCSELEQVSQIAEKVIADQDSAGYSLMRITKVLELTRNPT